MKIKKWCNAIFLLSSVSIFPNVSQAYTSIAGVPGHPQDTNYVSYNYASQKSADRNALEGCRVSARSNGAGNLDKKCKILDRAKGPGFGAIVCGGNGCSWSIAYDDAQAAVDSAYNDCAKLSDDCTQKGIANWDDESGFQNKTQVKSPISQSCRPRTSSITCSSQCMNGNCIITYENGCKMQVQVQPKFNPLNNQWEYPAPAC
jgi:hypothetical protein